MLLGFKKISTSSTLCSILLCFLHCFHILGLVLPFSHHAAMAKNHDIQPFPSLEHLFRTRTENKPSDETSFIQDRHKRRPLRRLWHQKSPSSASAVNSTESYIENTTKPLIQKENLSTSSNFSELQSSCCLASMTTQISKQRSGEWTTVEHNWSVTREITHEDIDITTTYSQQALNEEVQHKAAIVVGIVFGAIAAVLFIGAVSIIYVYVKRRLSHSTLSKTDLSSILEDHMTMSYIETRYDRQRNMSDEVISLDNDSFLQSLETTSLSYLPTPQKSV